jgi:hypothetical protein
MRVQRIDAVELSAPVEHPNGWIDADAVIARTGVLEYLLADGTRRVEYRPPEEHTDEMLASFDLVPVTNRHPPSGWLTASNTTQYQVGVVGAPRVDGQMVRAKVRLLSSSAVIAAKAGRTQLSCGYTCELDPSPGIAPDGTRYDAVQRRVSGNHVALVDVGRAGPDVRLRVDSLDLDVLADAVDESASVVTVCESQSPPAKDVSNMKVTIDGIDFDLPEPAAQAVEKMKGKLSEAEQKTHAETAKADAARVEVESLKAKLDALPKELESSMRARAALEQEVVVVLPDAKLDGLTDTDVKRLYSERVLGVDMTGKADAYVDAMFDVARTRKTTPVTAPVSAVGDSIHDAAARFAEASRKAYLPK